MSKTSDRAEVLSVAIARHFEKEPTTEDTREYLRNHGRRKPHDGWWEIARHSGKPVDLVESFYWRPLSCESPQVSMKLLKELLAKGYVLMQVGTQFSVCWPRQAAELGELARLQYHASPELAIAEAVTKAFNLEVG